MYIPQIINKVKETFNFLSKNYNYDLNVKEYNTGKIILQYRKNNKGIDIELELLQGFSLSIILVKLNNGKDPDGYYVNNNGERVRIHFPEYLLENQILPKNYLSNIKKKYEEIKVEKTNAEKEKLINKIIKMNYNLLKDNIYLIEDNSFF